MVRSAALLIEVLRVRNDSLRYPYYAWSRARPRSAYDGQSCRINQTRIGASDRKIAHFSVLAPQVVGWRQRSTGQIGPLRRAFGRRPVGRTQGRSLRVAGIA